LLTLTRTQDDYQEAEKTLEKYALLLQSYGFEVDVDDANKDLKPLYFNENKSSGGREARRGFLQLLPQ
jgi:hypothetical protein